MVKIKKIRRNTNTVTKIELTTGNLKRVLQKRKKALNSTIYQIAKKVKEIKEDTVDEKIKRKPRTNYYQTVDKIFAEEKKQGRKTSYPRFHTLAYIIDALDGKVFVVWGGAEEEDNTRTITLQQWEEYQRLRKKNIQL